MATAAVSAPVGAPSVGEKIENVTISQEAKPQKHNVRTVMNYYKEKEDGSPPDFRYVK